MDIIDIQTDTNYLCGLHNLGNTCYMNAVIQSLIHNKILIDYFTSREFQEGLLHNIIKKLTEHNLDFNDRDIVGKEISMSITFQMFQLFTNMKEEKSVIPKSFKQLISVKNETFMGFNQNDSHELLSFILDSLHEETKCDVEINCSKFPSVFHQTQQIIDKYVSMINSTSDLNEKFRYINEFKEFETNHQHEFALHGGINYWSKYLEKNFSVVSQNFSGTYHSTIECGKCRNCSHSFEVFTTMSLEIPEKQDITLYDCLDRFTSTEDLTSNNKYNCPKCHLSDSKKNISIWILPNTLIIHLKRFKINGNTIKKIANDIQYPPGLNMEKYICKYNKKPMNYDYKLTSIIHHRGNYGSGHYVTFAQCGDTNWYLFDDSGVMRIPPESVEKNIISNTGYILVYSKL